MFSKNNVLTFSPNYIVECYKTFGKVANMSNNLSLDIIGEKSADVLTRYGVALTDNMNDVISGTGKITAILEGKDANDVTKNLTSVIGELAETAATIINETREVTLPILTRAMEKEESIGSQSPYAGDTKRKYETFEAVGYKEPTLVVGGNPLMSDEPTAIIAGLKNLGQTMVDGLRSIKPIVEEINESGDNHSKAIVESFNSHRAKLETLAGHLTSITQSATDLVEVNIALTKAMASTSEDIRSNSTSKLAATMEDTKKNFDKTNNGII